MWCVTFGPYCAIFEIEEKDEGQVDFKLIHKWVTETRPRGKDTRGKEMSPEAEIGKVYKNKVVTAGSDGVNRVWSYPKVGASVHR